MFLNVFESPFKGQLKSDFFAAITRSYHCEEPSLQEMGEASDEEVSRLLRLWLAMTEKVMTLRIYFKS